MDTSLLIQYLIIGVLVLGASYYLFTIFRKNFSRKKTKETDSFCDKCGGH